MLAILNIHLMETNTSFSCKFCGEQFQQLTDVKAHEQACSLSHSAPIATVTPEKKSFTLTALLAILIIVVAAQTIQAQIVLRSLGAPKAASSALPASIQNLPDMVGGC